ncbi:MAG: hypothetical protein ABH874_05420 [Methanobacteriota archaeon]
MKLRDIKKAAQDFMYGMAAHDMATYSLRQRMHMEHLFMMITVGDMLGIPVLPPYYSLKLLPHVVPHVKTWKRTLMRERDITDTIMGGG